MSVLLLSFWFGSFAAAQSAVMVEWNDERLSVTAEKASLSQILREVARKTGLTIRGIDMVQEEVSVSFSRRTLREGLGRLLDQLDHVVTEDVAPEGGWRPAYALIFGRRAPSFQERMLAGKTVIAGDGTLLEDEALVQEPIPVGSGMPLADEPEAQEVIQAGGGTPLEDERQALEAVPLGGGMPLADEQRLREAVSVGGGTPLADERRAREVRVVGGIPLPDERGTRVEDSR